MPINSEIFQHRYLISISGPMIQCRMDIHFRDYLRGCSRNREKIVGRAEKLVPNFLIII
jgi:hypothetical protein